MDVKISVREDSVDVGDKVASRCVKGTEPRLSEAETLKQEVFEGILVVPNKGNENMQQAEDKRNKRFFPFHPRKYLVYFQMRGPSPEDYGSIPLEYVPESRNGFIRKTMGLVMAEILFTTAVLIVINVNETIKERLLPFSTMLMWAALIVLIIVQYAMVCTTCGRVLPCNMILLIIGTAAITAMAAVVTIILKTKILAIAAVGTLCVVAMCFALAFTNFDFTRFFLVVMAASLAVFVASLAVIVLRIFFDSKELTILQIVLSIALTLIQAVVLVIELQMVLGGRSLEFGIDDYAFAAFNIYSSIVMMFMRIALILFHFDT